MLATETQHNTISHELRIAHSCMKLTVNKSLQKLEECMGRKDEEEVKNIIREMEEWELVEVTEKVAGLGINVEGR